MSLDDKQKENTPHAAMGIKGQQPVHISQAPLQLQAAVPAASPSAVTAVVVSQTLAARLEALATNVESKFKADETKAKHLFEVYWPALAALVIGWLAGHFG